MEKLSEFLRESTKIQETCRKFERKRSTSIIKSHAGSALGYHRPNSRHEDRQIQPQVSTVKALYVSETCRKVKDKVTGWMRKTTQQEKLIRYSSFPLRYFVVNKQQQAMWILDEPGGSITKRVPFDQIFLVQENNPGLKIKGTPEDFKFSITVVTKE